MPHINLLPWREELRKQRRKEFITTTIVCALLMGIVVGGVHLEFSSRIKFQNKRNQYLEEQITRLDEGIKEIEELEDKKSRLIARMQIIQQLQASRPEIVRIFDEFVTARPEGVYFSKLEQKKRKFTIQGVAQSNARVSSLMRNLDGSEMLQDPELIQIKSDKQSDVGDILRLSDFGLRISQIKQKTQEEEDES